jgi:3'-phosphoadenosine 5'-phosphosulfate sulfotransferase (PAPS reductase)/FAD synthetase
MISKEKIQLAKERIDISFSLFGDKLFMGHSGGKDSCTILHLMKQVVPDDFIIVHNVKPMFGSTGDPVLSLTEMHPGTLYHLYENVAKDNVVHFMHSSKMEKFISDNDLQCQVDGARISEANREGKSANFIMGGKSYNRKELKAMIADGLFGIHFCYPIFDWTDRDVFDYLTSNDIPFSQEYFENGEIDRYLQERR